MYELISPERLGDVLKIYTGYHVLEAARSRGKLRVKPPYCHPQTCSIIYLLVGLHIHRDIPRLFATLRLLCSDWTDDCHAADDLCC